MDVLESFHLLLPGLLRIAAVTAVPVAAIQLYGAFFAYHNIDVAATTPNLSTIRNPIGVQPSSH
jgi:hypothetical protein